ncbi:hypothetical protein [Corynebacterium aquatimens]|uniref:DUF91 domain-containing protein n=1 Tax=Corynebacterium aquatimens TaxID=1190508 RepID=A0A931DWA0_9CORY|nr:hypothetical protein [Corynebacterium aquatimens]MBG6122679.1 hypothetical protein [Corynebacterium aquatimens]
MALYSIEKLANQDKRVNSVVRRIASSNMTKSKMTETNDLESWIVKNPSIINEALPASTEMMVITTQFNSWSTVVEEAFEGAADSSTTATSKKTLDILGLTNSGELVVVELKRASDKDIHLQAITYAAMASRFTYGQLAAAHDAWLRSPLRKSYYTDEELNAEVDGITESHEGSTAVNQDVSHDNDRNSSNASLNKIAAFVGGIDSPDEEFSVPRIILVAESFSVETMTTLIWLKKMSKKFDFTCIEYDVYQDGDDFFAHFNVAWPVKGEAELSLAPDVEELELNRTEEKVAQRRSENIAGYLVKRLPDGGWKIPEGEPVLLPLEKLQSSSFTDEHRARLAELSKHMQITWTNQGTPPSKSLKVSNLGEFDGEYALQAVWNLIMKEIGAVKGLPGQEQPIFRQASKYFVVGEKTLHEHAEDLRKQLGAHDL